MSTDSTTTPFVQPGTVLVDKYRILEPVCDGETASVFRALHLVLGEPVLLRVLRPELHRTSGAARRFVEGAKALMRLDVERVARVIDVGELDDGLPFMALQSLEGRSLRQEVQRRGSLPVDEAVALLRQLGQALETTRAAGIERDGLDPADVFISSGAGEARLQLIGLGISKAGTRDARADVFDLGSVLHRMVTGQAPGTADTVPAEAPPKDGDDRLAAIIRRARDPDPARRQGSIAELMAALEEPEPQRAAKTLVQGSLVPLPPAAGARSVGRTMESEGVPPAPVSAEPLVNVEGSTTGRPTLMSAGDAPSPPSSTVPEAPAAASRSITVPQGPLVTPPKDPPRSPLSHTMPQAPSLTEPGSMAATLREGTAPPAEPAWWEGRAWPIGVAAVAALLTALGLWWIAQDAPPSSEAPEPSPAKARKTAAPPASPSSTGPTPLVPEKPPATPAAPPPPPLPPPRPRRRVPRPPPPSKPPMNDVFL